MNTIFQIHALVGERLLPILIIAAAIWFTVTWKPDAGRTWPGRIFIWLIALQFVLGLIQWVVGLARGNMAYLNWPFILHPLLGLLAVVLAPLTVYPQAGGRFKRLGRWKPLALSLVLLLIVMGSIITGLSN
jgi:hypothetical protein